MQMSSMEKVIKWFFVVFLLQNCMDVRWDFQKRDSNWTKPGSCTRI